MAGEPLSSDHEATEVRHGWYAWRGLHAHCRCSTEPYFRTSLNWFGRSPKRRLR
jgi:hypothetical protein